MLVTERAADILTLVEADAEEGATNHRCYGVGDGRRTSYVPQLLHVAAELGLDPACIILRERQDDIVESNSRQSVHDEVTMK